MGPKLTHLLAGGVEGITTRQMNSRYNIIHHCFTDGSQSPCWCSATTPLVMRCKPHQMSYKNCPLAKPATPDPITHVHADGTETPCGCNVLTHADHRCLPLHMSYKHCPLAK
jgi:hypothetical protein